MSEEPRRSGRATKGQTNKNQDEPAPGPKSKKGSKAKAAKKDNRPVEEEEEDEEDYIRCICGTYDPEDEGTMICCDSCSAWQHNICMGMTEDEDELPKNYFCEQCRPGDHKALLEAIKRGERPEQVAARRREAVAAAEAEAERARKQKKGKKGKGGRPSKALETTESQAADGEGVASPAISESNKRKLQEDEHEQPAKQRKNTGRPTEERPAAKSKGKGRKSAGASGIDMVENIDQLQDDRKRVARALKPKIEAQIKAASQQKAFRIPDGDTPASLSDQLAIEIEHALHVNLTMDTKGSASSYGQQFRDIAANIGRNVDLVVRLLDGSLTADDLSKMTSTQMASDEQQRMMQEMKEEVDKQSILVQDEAGGPRVRRTHKGDEFVDDPNQATSDSMIAAPPPRRAESMSMAQSPIVRDTDAGSPMHIDTAQSANRRSSSTFDIQNVWSSVQSPTGEQLNALRDSHKRASVGNYFASTPVATKQEHDADIDRLLNDAEDNLPLSAEEIAQINASIWHGVVDMPSAAGTIAKFSASAYHVAGGDLYGRSGTLSDLFPPSLTLAGRIAADKANEYIMTLAPSVSTEVTVCRILPDRDDPSAAEEFKKLFNYFVNRQRWGVLSEKGRADNVRDVYLIPLEAGAGPVPEFLEALAYNIIEQPRPVPMFCVVFVTKWEGPGPGGNDPTSNHPDASNMSPYTPGPNQQQFPGQPSIPHASSAMSPITGNTPFGQPNQPTPSQQVSYHGMPPPPPAQAQYPQHQPYSLQQQAHVQYAPGPSPSGGFPSHPYASNAPPPQHQAPQPSSRPATVALAQQILGPFFNCPTAQTIMSMDSVPEDSLHNLRKIFEQNPATQHDMDAFQKHLNEMQASG